MTASLSLGPEAAQAPEGIVNLLISLYKFCSVWPTRPMKTAMPANPYKHHRFPAEIISHAVWLYVRFASAIATWKSSSSPAASR